VKRNHRVKEPKVEDSEDIEFKFKDPFLFNFPFVTKQDFFSSY